MQTSNRFFDDLARMASGAAGGLAGLRQEIEGRVREQVERFLAGMDLPSRDEFEAVKAMAAEARAEQERLAVRLSDLERKLAEAEALEGDAVRQSGSPSPLVGEGRGEGSGARPRADDSSE